MDADEYIRRRAQHEKRRGQVDLWYVVNMHRRDLGLPEVPMEEIVTVAIDPAMVREDMQRSVGEMRDAFKRVRAGVQEFVKGFNRAMAAMRKSRNDDPDDYTLVN